MTVIIAAVLLGMVTSDALDGDGWLSAGVLAAATISSLPTIIIIVAVFGTARLALRTAAAIFPAKRNAVGPRRNKPRLEAALDRELLRLDRQIEGRS